MSGIALHGKQIITTSDRVPPLDELAVPLPAAFRCDLRDNSLIWAPGVFDLFGYARGTAPDRREVVELYTGESRELLERLRSEAIATAGSFTFEADIVRLDGTPRRIRITADTQKVAGKTRWLYGLKQDITHA